MTPWSTSGNRDPIPSGSFIYSTFYRTLKNGNILAEEYQLCQKVWEDNNMTSMKEFLI
jgi:hypothetical protein